MDNVEAPEVPRQEFRGTSGELVKGLAGREVPEWQIKSPSEGTP